MAHSFVCSGCVAWTSVEGSSRSEPLVFPPRELENVDAQHIGAALLLNLEKYLFGTTLSEFLAKAAKRFRVMSVALVGDAATANRKVVSQLFHHLSQAATAHDVVMTMSWTPCFLHQCARILLLQLEQRQLSAGLYSITRLHQHSNTRQKTAESMRRLLAERFEYTRDPPPVAVICPSNGTAFRSSLFQLLSELGGWDGEAAESAPEILSERSDLLQRLLHFFNGNITQSERWTHHCVGSDCHRNREEASREVLRLACSTIFINPCLRLAQCENDNVRSVDWLLPPDVLSV